MSSRDPDHLKFLFEGSEEFCCLPTFAIIPAQSSMLGHDIYSIPGLNIDVTRVRATEFVLLGIGKSFKYIKL